ncbi:MAG: DUF1501 domain-containing protein, partial [Planctomycetes bacterium]|nr:DUF1501 domain-containing protein [Planctomycetota bacterium]
MTTTRSANALSRRDLLRLTAAGFVGASMSGWLENMAEAAAKDPQRKRSCILLWMNGGPSQMDTFDLKPGHANGGPFKETATNAPGVRFSEHLPKLAKHGDKLAIVRSMKTKEADHGRATYLMRTGRPPGGPIQYPVLGSLVAKELERPDSELPGFVSIAPIRFLSPGAFGSGFLSPQYAPLIVGENAGNFGGGPQQDAAQFLKVQDLDLPTGISAKRSAARVKMLDEMEEDFIAERPGSASVAHRAAYQRAV